MKSPMQWFPNIDEWNHQRNSTNLKYDRGAWLFGIAGGALAGGAVAYGYDGYLESKRGPVLTPTQADLQKKLLGKR